MAKAKKAPAKKKAGVKPTGTLTAKKRAKVPAKKFGIPPKGKGESKTPGKYPMPDKSHAANAKARATQQYKVGGISKDTLQKIHAKADKILHGSTAKAKAAGATTAATSKGGGKQPTRTKAGQQKADKRKR